MEPHLGGIEDQHIRLEEQVFCLDITNYKDALPQIMEEYWADFPEFYEYPLHSFVFHPSSGVRI